MNVYAFLANQPASRIDHLGLSPRLLTGHVLNQKLSDGGRAIATVTAPFRTSDVAIAEKALCIIRKLIGSDYKAPNYLDFYFGTWSGQAKGYTFEYPGVSITPDPTTSPRSGDRWALIEMSLLPKSEANVLQMAEFGKTLAHEADHYWRGSDEDTAWTLIDERVDRSLERATSVRVSFCCRNGRWDGRTLLDLYACECGVKR